MNYVIAHDLGTTGNKATLYDRDGALIGASFYAYDTEYAHTGWAEQNPNDWWKAVCQSTRRLLSETGVSRDDIACITFSGQMMGAAPLDRDGRPLRNAIIWADQRALAQERWIGERLAFDEVYGITGHRLSASYSLAKILWIRENQPDIYRDTLQVRPRQGQRCRPLDRRLRHRPLGCLQHEFVRPGSGRVVGRDPGRGGAAG